MTSGPLVSVIINCYNGAAFLRETLDSVLQQTYKNWEVIFWDNRSTDSSAAIFAEYRDRDPRFRYFLAPAFTTLGEARNLAVEKAGGEFIGFLDSDDLWLPEKLEKQVPLFGNPDVDLVYSDAVSFNALGETRQLGRGKTLFRGKCFKELLRDNFLMIQTVLVRSKVFSGRQGIKFDTSFEIIEEYDVFLRIAYGGAIDYVDEVLAKWRVHGASASWTRFSQMADETERLMGSLRTMDASVPITYEKEWNKRLDWIVRRRALGFWIAARGRECRSIIVQGQRVSLDLLALYLLSFLPSKNFVRLLYWLRGSSVFPDAS